MAMKKIKCPGCGATLSLSEEHKGKVKCPVCRCEFNVSEAKSAPEN